MQNDRPFCVPVILDVELALAEGIPEFDSSVSAPAHDLPVVSTKTDAKDVGLVSNKATGRLTGIQVPETKSMIPRRGEGKLAVRGDDNVRDEVVVPVKNTLGKPVLFFRACQLPNNDSLVWLDT
jgi:hypothetical protein